MAPKQKTKKKTFNDNEREVCCRRWKPEKNVLFKSVSTGVTEQPCVTLSKHICVLSKDALSPWQAPQCLQAVSSVPYLQTQGETQ